MPAQDEALARQLRQAAVKAARTGLPVQSRFFPCAAQSVAVHEARLNEVLVAFDGGWPQAERAQACFYPPEEEPAFTGVWLRVDWNGRFGAPAHRDLLGSLMGLGIDRAWFGDLMLQGDHALLYCLPPMNDRLPLEWTQAGHITIRVYAVDAPPTLTREAGEARRVTVASLRLDSVLSGGLRLSRARAAELIRMGLVAVNHQTEERVDRLLSPGDLLSVRGYGRIALTAVGEETRRERLPVTLELFTDR